LTLKGIPGAKRSRPPTFAGRAESDITVTLLTAAECRDKAEQKMTEAANLARAAIAKHRITMKRLREPIEG